MPSLPLTLCIDAYPESNTNLAYSARIATRILYFTSPIWAISHQMGRGRQSEISMINFGLILTGPKYILHKPHNFLSDNGRWRTTDVMSIHVVLFYNNDHLDRFPYHFWEGQVDIDAPFFHWVLEGIALRQSDTCGGRLSVPYSFFHIASLFSSVSSPSSSKES